MRFRRHSATLLLLTTSLVAHAADTTTARTALLQGRVDEAATQLKSILGSEPRNPVAHQLLCRVFYAQNLADPAIHECEQAVATAPSDSDNQLWMGRAYGLKAGHASAFTALSLAKKVHESFEQAAAADPGNVHALSDLGEFYIAAPGLVGGGLDKAQALASRMQTRFPAKSHRLLALIAVKKNDLTTAESQFKLAIEAGKSPASYIDLASFYQHHGKLDQAVTALESAISADRAKDASLVDAASILTAAHRSPELAEQLLREYLASPAKSDEAPAFKVHLQLGDLFSRRGDSTAAHAEYTAALALASDYAPARRAIQSP